MNSDEAELPELTLQAIEWLVRLRSDDMSEEETHTFADWLSKDALHTEAFAEAEDLFQNLTIAAKTPRDISPILASPSKISATQDRTPVVSTPINKLSARRHVSILNKSWLAMPLALAAAWLFAVALVMPKQSHLWDDYLSDYHTNTGEQRNIQLADGSQLLLNTNTAVSVDYQASLRQITLHHGQVRFTVAKDGKRPFEVKSDGLLVRALGTVFEVYNSEYGETRVTVQEHAVAARLQPETQTNGNSQPDTITVQEGQQLRYGGNGILSLPKPVDLAQTSAWQQHKIYINDRPLGELIAELDRYRVGRIFLSDAKLLNLRVVGVFSLTDPDAVLEKVCNVLALQETRLDPWWVILHR
jgi:transmembrane sensor